jgi:chemotaxis protein CheX
MELKEQITNFLGECVKEVFTTMLKAEVKPGEPISTLTQPDGFICSAGFSGMVEGAVAISLSNPGACKIVSKMSGKETAQVSPEVTDGIGKVLNNIAQGLKTRMAKLSCDLEVGVVTTTRGKDLKLAASADKMEVPLSFSLEDFEFGVSVLYKVMAEGKAETPQTETAGKEAEQPAVTAPPESPVKDVEAPAPQPALAETLKVEDTLAKDDTAVVAPAQESTEKVPPQAVEETPSHEKKEEKPVEAEETSASQPTAPLDDSLKQAEALPEPPQETTEIKSKDAASDPSVAAQGTTDKAQGEKPVVPELVKEEPLSEKKKPSMENSDQAVSATPDQLVVVAVPKAKLEKIIARLDQDPKAMVPKSEVKDVLGALLETSASLKYPPDVSSVAEVDAILARLDHILEKCKTLK